MYKLEPITQSIERQSDVITQLKQSNVYTNGTSQNKLDSKFYQANDGYVYFTSTDENGVNSTKGILPTSGSHFWRKKPESENWEHLLATKEALIALNSDGRFVYALGYWNHVLYQYDTLSQRFNRRTVGSIKGHVSYNFIVDNNERVFVPKVERDANGSILSSLMEYDSNLNLIDIHPIEHYWTDDKHMRRGIVAYAHMKNGDVYFITGLGALYKLSVSNNDKRNLEFISFIDEANQPGGYFPSLFSIDGSDFLVGLGKLPDNKTYSWFIYQISSKTLVTYNLETLDNSFLLFGSLTIDNEGNMYMVGADSSDGVRQEPKIFQLSYSDNATVP